MSVDLIRILGANVTAMLFIFSKSYLRDSSTIVSILGFAAFVFLFWIFVFKINDMGNKIEQYEKDIEYLENTIYDLMNTKNADRR